MSSLNFKFSNLLGAPYRGGNLLLHGTELLSAVGNRVSQVRRGQGPGGACSHCRRPRSRASVDARCSGAPRPAQVDLTASVSSTLPFECAKQVRPVHFLHSPALVQAGPVSPASHRPRRAPVVPPARAHPCACTHQLPEWAVLCSWALCAAARRAPRPPESLLHFAA